MDKTEKALQRINRGIVLAVESDDKEAIEDLKVTIQALEKQVGKRPESEYDDEFTCPNCGTYHEAYDVTALKYCPECGQKIDWGDE